MKNGTVAGALAATLACALSVSPVQADPPPPTTWEEFNSQALAIAPIVSVLAAEVTDGTCEAVNDLDADMTTPIGSGFKLFILDELGAQIGDRARRGGRLKWEAPVEIQAKYKAIPAGPLLFVPDGSVYSTRYIAEQMIQVSDNTATDHLLFLVGRENVERRMGLDGHHDPSLNTPLFSTREFGVLKFLWTEEQLEEYENASVAKRRQLLAAEKRGWPELEAYFDEHGDQTEPARIETVEWFANRFDMCGVMMSLYERGQNVKKELPLLEVLTLFDPIGFDREKWIYVGFKGGSEIGVQAGNWLVKRDDGRVFFFSAAFADPDAPLDLGALLPLLFAAPDILYATP
ncbi:MAG TPA: serine hydrolase [Kiloniellaceae bacterium]|nr:serine hydrolase [Kiloniellaceae bacterium]